jgi:hypothetical protein
MFAELPNVALGNPVFRETQCESHWCVVIELFAILLSAQVNVEKGCPVETVRESERGVSN